MKTLRPTQGTLSSGNGREPKRLDVPAGLRVTPCQDGSGQAFVEDWRLLGLDVWDSWDADTRGVRVPLTDCGDPA